MRHWNLQKKRATVTWKKLVFTLPMRHWNISIKTTWLLHGLRFYPTYEALKQAGQYVEFDPYVPFLPYLWGIETTNCYLYPARAFWFLPYLWGIETSMISLIIPQVVMFLPYLWGIETLWSYHVWNKYNRFYPTYEALKLWYDRIPKIRNT